MSPSPPQNPTVAVSPMSMLGVTADTGRREHYGEFYGLREAPEGAGVIVGNCQAESLRIVVDGPATPTVRVPPVHELTAHDVPHLQRLIARASFLAVQPIRDDYHDLPLGTRQLVGLLRPTARAVTVPIVRYTGLYPFQWVIRVPEVTTMPPFVDYLDVRELALAAGLPLPAQLDPAGVRAVAEDSLAELRRREGDLDVAASDLFAQPTFDHMRTVNHPGNPIWLGLGARVLEALGSSAAPTDPGRPILNGVQAPREAWVADAWDLDEEPRDDWSIDGARVPSAEVRAAQGAWYRDNPVYIERAIARLAPLLARWRA
ncbi:WcbI family polysaccharide biosynthesis putative acetyltransferase [Microbacterium sp. P06]|uniref:WcbI family polysaccharide biosynthesis putative acetyltransferase n=1 Tax=Microbacterium sp. P06 TaxID=3366949 RepID=UPI003746CD00